MSDNFDKFAILESFLDEVSSYLPEIEENLDALQQRPDDMNVIEETYRRAHTIGGSAAMMDFGNLAHVAQGIEEILGHAIDAQTALDAPAIALLRRSFSRLSRLVENIRTNTDGTALVSEDDADRAAWRGGNPPSADALAAASGLHGGGAMMPRGDISQPAIVATDSASGMAVPDWLAPFAASGDYPSPISPMAASGQFPQAAEIGDADLDPASTPTGPMPAVQPRQATPPGQFSQSRPGMASPSQSDPWASSISGYPTGQVPNLAQAPAAPSSAYTGEAPDSYDDILSAFTAAPLENQENATERLATAPRLSAVPPSVTGPMPWQRPVGQDVDLSTLGTNQMPSMGGVHQEASAPVRQDAASSDAATPSLDDLRLSEEAVQRQVATLRDVASSIYNAAKAMEDERIELRGFLDGSRDSLDRLEQWAGRQMGLDLQRSPDSVRRYLPLSVIWVTTMRLKRMVGLLNNAGRGVTATEEQIEETLDELRATMSSFGQIYRSMSSMTSMGGAPDNGFSATVAQFAWNPPAASLPEVPVLTAGTRAELERDIREQLRRELEDEVRAEIASEVRRDEEDQLRQELQIQVRRELLAELTPTPGANMGGMGSILSSIPMGTGRSSGPVQITSDQSVEAIEVFREEAQEHLQSITTGIAELESSPRDTSILQNIRRAMHTLKGAAGMMGFSVIQQTAHVSEDLLDRLVEQGLSLTPEVLSLLLDTSEALDFMITKALGQPGEQQRVLQSLSGRYAQLTGVQISDGVPW